MSQKLKVGIAGYGVVGKRRRLFIDKHPDLKTVAVCDITFKRAGEFDDGLRFYQNYNQLLENEKLDILFVCLPNDIAPKVTIAGLESNLHVFCEKPPGRDLDDIADVIRCERKHPNLKLKYGFNHRYHDSIKDSLEIIRSKSLGEVINIRGVYGKSQMISFESQWRTQREVSGGGILLDQGIHMLDMYRLFVGEFAEINSYVDNRFWNHNVEDNAYALMKTESGVVAFIHSTATQWRHRFQLEIALEKGGINLSGILSGSKSYGHEKITVVNRGDNDKGNPVEVTTQYNTDNSWWEEIEEFADCIKKDKPVHYGSSYDAYKTMELVYRIYCADPQWKEKYNLSDKPKTEI